LPNFSRISAKRPELRYEIDGVVDGLSYLRWQEKLALAFETPSRREHALTRSAALRVMDELKVRIFGLATRSSCAVPT
jgi:hypothetical protein